MIDSLPEKPIPCDRFQAAVVWQSCDVIVQQLLLQLTSATSTLLRLLLQESLQLLCLEWVTPSKAHPRPGLCPTKGWKKDSASQFHLLVCQVTLSSHHPAAATQNSTAPAAVCTATSDLHRCTQAAFCNPNTCVCSCLIQHF